MDGGCGGEKGKREEGRERRVYLVKGEDSGERATVEAVEMGKERKGIPIRERKRRIEGRNGKDRMEGVRKDRRRGGHKEGKIRTERQREGRTQGRDDDD